MRNYEEYKQWRKDIFNIKEDGFDFLENSEPKSVKNILKQKNSEMLLQFYCIELLKLAEYEYYFGLQQQLEVSKFDENRVNNNLFMPILNN